MDGGEIAPDFFIRPVPPPDLQQSGDDFVGKTPSDCMGGHATDDGIGRYIFRYHGAGADNSPVADGYPGHDDCFVPNPYVVSNMDIAFVVPGAGTACTGRPHSSKKMGNG